MLETSPSHPVDNLIRLSTYSIFETRFENCNQFSPHQFHLIYPFFGHVSLHGVEPITKVSQSWNDVAEHVLVLS
jgi:hypothetical protein